nr:MAG TPA: hypothetical protein [Caudoviricetes sp.]
MGADGRGAQVASCGFARCWWSGLTVRLTLSYSGCADRGPPGRTGVESSFPPSHSQAGLAFAVRALAC